MHTVTITIKNPDELEALTAAELSAYQTLIRDQIAALKSVAWDVDMEGWMRECPLRLAERETVNTLLAEARAEWMDAPSSEARRAA